MIASSSPLNDCSRILAVVSHVYMHTGVQSSSRKQLVNVSVVGGASSVDVHVWSWRVKTPKHRNSRTFPFQLPFSHRSQPGPHPAATPPEALPLRADWREAADRRMIVSSAFIHQAAHYSHRRRSAGHEVSHAAPGTDSAP